MGDRQSAALRSVLDLPGVVERVPGDTPGGVLQRPFAVGKGRAVRWLAKDVQDGRTTRLDRVAVVRRRLALFDAELAGVVPVGLDHVRDHLVALAAATPP